MEKRRWSDKKRGIKMKEGEKELLGRKVQGAIIVE